MNLFEIIATHMGMIGIIILIVLFIIIIASGYVKSPPDTAFIISGFKKEPRILIGKAGIKIPFLERLDKLSLRQITIDIKTEGYIPTLDFINIKVDAVAKVKVDTKPEMMKLAMQNFLNRNSEQIIEDLQDSLQGNMREIIGTIDLKTVCNNRDEFGNQVQCKAQKDMQKLGIEIISCNIQNVSDENGLISDMGMDNTSKIKKDAAIAKAESERDIKIAQAEADKLANDAKVKADLEIASKQNDLAIKKSELQKEADVKKAEADAAYGIQEQEQRKSIEIASANADIAKQEREVELKQKEVAVKEQTLDAEIKKQAEADRYAQQQKSDAELYKRQKDAEAKKFEIEKDAEAEKARAEAAKYAKEQEAIGIQKVGEAEAEAIRAKGLAEAEAMDKKAEAYSKYNKAAMAEMLISVLPEIAGKVAEPLTQIDKITIIGGGDGNDGVSSVAGNVPLMMAKTMETVKEATGIDLAEIIRADSFEGKTTKNINFTGFPNSEVMEEVKKELAPLSTEDNQNE